MNIDRLVVRLRRNQDHPSYDEDDSQPPHLLQQPQYQQDQQSPQQQHQHADHQQRGVSISTPITHENAREKRGYHHERDARDDATLQAECTELRRQLAFLHEQMDAWNSSKAINHLVVIYLT